MRVTLCGLSWEEEHKYKQEMLTPFLKQVVLDVDSRNIDDVADQGSIKKPSTQAGQSSSNKDLTMMQPFITMITIRITILISTQSPPTTHHPARQYQISQHPILCDYCLDPSNKAWHAAVGGSC
jgi:hypothetical protein